MKKKNLIAVLIIFVLAAAVLFLGLYFRGGAKSPLPPEAEPTESAAPEEGTADESAENAENTAPEAGTAAEKTREYLEKYPSESYLLVRTANSVFAPIPLTEEGSFKIAQADGSENVVHVGKNSFYMESSNCDNQNCVGEGEVTLENKDSRVLFNMVLCLPHELSLELLTPEETETVLLELYTAQENEGFADAAE